MVSGGATYTTWPLSEDYCRTMPLSHWPSWFEIQEVKGDAASWVDRFKDFVSTEGSPTFVRAQRAKAQCYVDHLQEHVFEEEEEKEDGAVEAEEQSDWTDVYAGKTQRSKGVEKEVDCDDRGENDNWSSTSIILPEGKDPTKWLLESVKQMKETETEDLQLLQVSFVSR